MRSDGATTGRTIPKYGIFKEKLAPSNRVCSLCGEDLRIEDGKIMSLVGETDGVITRMPFHLECLRRHRGDRSLRSRIRAVVKMIDERNGRGVTR